MPLLKYVSGSFKMFSSFSCTLSYAFTFQSTSSSSAACLLTDIVIGREEGFYTLTNASLSRFVELFTAEHVTCNVCSSRQRLFSNPLQHRHGASKQTAENRAEPVTSLTARSLKNRQ